MADALAQTASTSDSRRRKRSSGEKRKRKKERDRDTPPIPTSSLPKQPSGDSSHPAPVEPAPVVPAAELGDDFVPFFLSEPEDDDPPPAPKREWDEGKRSPPRNRERERDRKGKGREHDEGRRGGYAADAASSRRAPWVYDVEWEKCPNVAEMYVSLVMGMLYYVED